jgi:hypothetical protein
METPKQNMYQRGQIYAIRSHQTTGVYYGSTTQSLSKRLHEHKNNYKSYLNEKGHYISSFEILKYDDSYIELVLDFPCNSKKELNRREGQIIRNNECVNKIIAGRTKQEYYIDNKVKYIEYYNDNKDQKLEYQKKYDDEHKEQKIEYQKQNKEHIAEYKKQYNLNKKQSTLEFSAVSP